MNAALWLLIGVAPLTAAAPAAEGEGPVWARAALAQAVIASTDIDDPFQRAQALAEVAEAHVSAGDNPAAVQLLQLAGQAATSLESNALSAWALHDIALAYAKAGDLASARATAEAIGEPRLRDAALAAVVDALRTEHDFARAREIASRIQDVGRQGQTLRSIVIAQASLGDVEGALTTARGILHATFGAIALGDVAGSLARQGHFSEARRLAARIRDEQVRRNAITDIVSAQVSAGDVEGAFVAAGAMEDKLSRAEALGHVAAGRALHGRRTQAKDLFSEAIALARGARGSADRKCAVLVEIAREQIASGELSGARQTVLLALDALGNVKRNSDRVMLAGRIAPLQSRMGDHAGAMATAWRAEDSSLRPLLIRDIAASQAQAGDIAGAVNAARALDDRSAGVAAFFGILRVQSQARDGPGMRATIEAAFEIVRIMRNEELKAGALASLAAAQILAGDDEGARSTFEEAMSAAASVDPGPARAAAYSRIADALVVRGS